MSRTFQAARAALAALLLGTAQLRAQACTDPFYRWTEKTDASLAVKTATKVTIPTMLTWAALPIYAGTQYECTDRQGRELKTYSVTGWVRRLKKETGTDGDQDWHVELTSTKTGDVTKCIVVEIPDPRYGALYENARSDFLALLGGQSPNASGDFTTPVRMRFIGAAFFDGQHRGARGTSNPPHQHGRCNSTTAALWEIHPVYWVKTP